MVRLDKIRVFNAVNIELAYKALAIYSPQEVASYGQDEVVRAVELVRRIRDEQAEELAGKSNEEIIAFFRRAGEEARKAAQDRLASQRSR